MVEVVRGVWTTEEGECGGEERETRPQAEAEMGWYVNRDSLNLCLYLLTIVVLLLNEIIIKLLHSVFVCSEAGVFS